MSIYIKGMEMPKEGTVFVIDSAGQVWSNKWPTRGYINWCSDLLMNEAADMIWRLNKTLNKTLDRVGARCG